ASVSVTSLGLCERKMEICDSPNVHSDRSAQTEKRCSLSDERVRSLLLSDRGCRAVARVDLGSIGEDIEFFANSLEEKFQIATQIGAADRALEEHVATEGDRRIELGADVRYRSGAVARNLPDLENQARHLDPISIIDDSVGVWAAKGDPKRRAQVEVRVQQQRPVVAPDPEGRIRIRLLHR